MKLLPARAPNVEKLRRNGDVDGLIQALGYEDVITDRRGAVIDLGAPVREGAARGLGAIDGPTPSLGLLRTLDDPEESVRLAGIQGLQGRRDPAVTSGLLEAVAAWVQPSHAASRREALEALTAVSDGTLSGRLAMALRRRPIPLAEPDVDALRSLASADRAVVGSERAVGSLIGALRSDPDEWIRARAAELLVSLAPDSVEALIDVLRDGEAEHQRRAAAALGQIRDSRAVDALSGLLEADDMGVREAAAVALGEIKDPSAVEALIRASGDSSYEVRAAATEALDKLGTAAVILGITALVRPLLAKGAAPENGSMIEGQLERALRAPALPAAPAAAPAAIAPARLAPMPPRPAPRQRGLFRRFLDRDT